MGDDPVETPSRSCAVHLRCMLGPPSGVSLPLIITVGHAIWDAYLQRIAIALHSGFRTLNEHGRWELVGGV